MCCVVGWKEEKVSGRRVQEYTWLSVVCRTCRQHRTKTNQNKKFSKWRKSRNSQQATRTTNFRKRRRSRKLQSTGKQAKSKNPSLVAEKTGEFSSQIIIDLKVGPQTHFSAKSQSEGIIQLVPESRKMAINIARRWRGTWEGVPMATWCSEGICRIGGELVPHVVIISSTLSFVHWRGAAVGRASIILLIVRLCTRFSSFFRSPVFSATTSRYAKRGKERVKVF